MVLNLLLSVDTDKRRVNINESIYNYVQHLCNRNIAETLLIHTLLRHCWAFVETLLRECWDNAEILLRKWWYSIQTMLRHNWGIDESLLRNFWDITLIGHYWDNVKTLLNVNFLYITFWNRTFRLRKHLFSIHSSVFTIKKKSPPLYNK